MHARLQHNPEPNRLADKIAPENKDENKGENKEQERVGRFHPA
jgi:hypothetical protein